MTALVVTGAAGYVGSRLARAAVADGRFSVRSVVRRARPWLAGEVLETESLEKGAAAVVEGADAVIHLAGANEVAAGTDPDGSLAATVAAGRAMADACARAGVRRLIYLSTVHVYGAALAPGATVDEQTVPAPRHSYAVARLATEHTMAGWSGPTELVVFRLTNGVGPPADTDVDRWSLVANDLCRQAAGGGPLRLLTAGLQWRDFVALDDVDRVLLAAAGPDGIAPGTYNLGSGEPTTVRALADLVADEAERLGLGRVAVSAPPFTGEPPGPYRVSVEKLAAAGFRATTPLRDALAATLRFCVDAGARREA